MSELMLILILIATIVYVTKPYWQRTAVRLNSGNGQLSELTSQRDNLLASIKEIEFDYETGKISAEDFGEMNAKYRSEAVTILKRIDGLRGNSRASQKLEAELRQLRLQQKSKAMKFCSECGASLQVSDRFCFQCGYRL